MCLVAVRGEEPESRKMSNSPHGARPIDYKKLYGERERQKKEDHECAPSVSAETMCFGPVIQQVGVKYEKVKCD